MMRRGYGSAGQQISTGAHASRMQCSSGPGLSASRRNARTKASGFCGYYSFVNKAPVDRHPQYCTGDVNHYIAHRGRA